MKKVIICLLISLICLYCDPMPLKIYIRNYLVNGIRVKVTCDQKINDKVKSVLLYEDNVTQDITYNTHKDYEKTLAINKIDDSTYEFIIKPKTTVFLEPYSIAINIEMVEIIYNSNRKTIMFYGKDFNREEMQRTGILEFKYPLAIINIK